MFVQYNLAHFHQNYDLFEDTTQYKLHPTQAKAAAKKKTSVKKKKNISAHFF